MPMKTGSDSGRQRGQCCWKCLKWFWEGGKENENRTQAAQNDHRNLKAPEQIPVSTAVLCEPLDLILALSDRQPCSLRKVAVSPHSAPPQVESRLSLPVDPGVPTAGLDSSPRIIALQGRLSSRLTLPICPGLVDSPPTKRDVFSFLPEPTPGLALLSPLRANSGRRFRPIGLGGHNGSHGFRPRRGAVGSRASAWGRSPGRGWPILDDLRDESRPGPHPHDISNRGTEKSISSGRARRTSLSSTRLVGRGIW